MKVSLSLLSILLDTGCVFNFWKCPEAFYLRHLKTVNIYFWRRETVCRITFHLIYSLSWEQARVFVHGRALVRCGEAGQSQGQAGEFKNCCRRNGFFFKCSMKSWIKMKQVSKISDIRCKTFSKVREVFKKKVWKIKTPPPPLWKEDPKIHFLEFITWLFILSFMVSVKARIKVRIQSLSRISLLS